MLQAFSLNGAATSASLGFLRTCLAMSVVIGLNYSFPMNEPSKWKYLGVEAGWGSSHRLGTDRKENNIKDFLNIGKQKSRMCQLEIYLGELWYGVVGPWVEAPPPLSLLASLTEVEQERCLLSQPPL